MMHTGLKSVQVQSNPFHICYIFVEVAVYWHYAYTCMPNVGASPLLCLALLHPNWTPPAVSQTWNLLFCSVLTLTLLDPYMA